MKRFMNFIGKIRQNEKAVFLGKVIFFYLLLMILWMHFMLAKDSAAPAFIYEQFKTIPVWNAIYNLRLYNKINQPSKINASLAL